MSTLEDRLRDAFRADAETVRPGAIPGPPAPPLRSRPARRGPGRPRSSRARVLIPLAAAAAVVAIVVGIALAAPLLHGRGHRASSPGVPASAPAPGVPRFYVTAYVAPAGGGNYLVVRDTETGKVTGQINPPGNAFFAGLAATAGARTFVTSISPATGCAAQLYQFRLNDQGVPGPLVPLHITLAESIFQGEGGLAITPDGRTIAYFARCTAARAEVGVINLATRQVRVWSVNLDPPSDVRSMTLSADGSLLGYVLFPDGGARILKTSAPAGSLLERSQTVSRTALWAALAGDGASLYGCTVSPFNGVILPNAHTLTYYTTSLVSGLQRVIASWSDVTGPQCWASLDTTGHYLLVEFPTTVPGASGWSRPAILDLRTGRLTDINAPAFYRPFDIAW